MTDIYTEITQERERQDKQWGGPAHDDSHTYYEWCDFIDWQLTRAYGRNADYRERLVKIAALAVAAIESFDRVKR